MGEIVLLNQMTNTNYENCKIGKHKLTVSWFKGNTEHKSCHCGQLHIRTSK